jgi:hypothetical protein
MDVGVGVGLIVGKILPPGEKMGYTLKSGIRRQNPTMFL